MLSPTVAATWAGHVRFSRNVCPVNKEIIIIFLKVPQRTLMS